MKAIITMKPSTMNVDPEIQQAVGLQEQIRRRAFELYEQRGHTDGHELDDWLQAEAEVKQMSAAA